MKLNLIKALLPLLFITQLTLAEGCLLYTSDAADE